MTISGFFLRLASFASSSFIIHGKKSNYIEDFIFFGGETREFIKGIRARKMNLPSVIKKVFPTDFKEAF